MNKICLKTAQKITIMNGTRNDEILYKKFIKRERGRESERRKSGNKIQLNYYFSGLLLLFSLQQVTLDQVIFC